MFKRILLGALSLVILAVGVQADNWSIDAAHSSIGFSVRHMVISKTTGKFLDFDGAFEFDGKDLSAGSGTVTVQMASVDTDDAKRDDHLRSPEFFGVATFPTMSFKSKAVKPGNEGAFDLIGDLTIRDVTKEVTFAGLLNGVVADPWGGTRAGFSAEATIDRQDFGITWSKALDTGGLMVGNDVSITIELELVKAD